MDNVSNYVKLCGCMQSPPVYSHSGMYERFYTFPICVSRLSENTDVINVILRESMLETEITDGSHICIEGEIHSYNNKSGIGNKLVISVYAGSIYCSDEEDTNIVKIKGSFCKTPNFRVTPMGRDICDLMLAVNRRCGRSDYLPCICWGRRAREAALLGVGDRLELSGRIQSRPYIKLIDGQPAEKTAYEVSVTDMEAV